ncbi:MAG: ABC transporter permease subunit [Proteobacteria bacterium]|nr:ABC transporter permease subunit [Pseudomonadota bacterium]NIS71239.1 ABC transporter permease subunit [Pseudomonadota bacterium]
MDFLWKALEHSIRLILCFENETYGIVFRSLGFSLSATVLAVLCGVPFGYLIGSREFHGRAFVMVLLNTTMALPTVVVGLIGYSLLSRSAPLGFLNLMFTPKAVILGEFLLSLPIITNLTVAAVQSVDPRAMWTARTLGAGSIQTAWTLLMEARFALIAAIIAGYGRAVSEVGSAMMLGGNIRFYTRTMTTAIALETSKGEFGLGLALGFLLLLVVFSINILIHYLQLKGRKR